MFGITPQSTPSRPASGRVTANSLEDIRHGSNSSTYDNSAAERMKMEHLRQERERREKERNRMMYDGKKRELDRLVQEDERMRVEIRRLEAEVVKYDHDVAGIRQAEKVEQGHVPQLKKEELQLTQTIQRLESELQQAKVRHQKVVQDMAQMEQKDKSTLADIHKRESYAVGVKSKLDETKRRSEAGKKALTALQAEVADLKRKI